MIPKTHLQLLYSQNHSMAEIAERTHYSLHTVVYWMNKYGIQRRTRSDAMYVKLNPGGNPFDIKIHLSPEEKMLLGLGLGIYWGEGEKASRHAIRVANTDVAIIKVFKRFIIDICQIQKNKIHYSIVCFNDSNPQEVKRYWAKELRTSPEKFGTIVQIRPQGKGTYKRKSTFGVCTITVSNIKLKQWIMKQLEEVKHAWIA